MANHFQEHLAYVTYLRTEHKRLQESLSAIEKQVAICRQSSDPREHVVPIANRLRSLRAALAHHFEEEESGGCLEEAISLQASLSHEMTRLEHQHPELLGQIDQLIERLRVGSNSRESTNEIIEEFQNFAERLSAHEAAENSILEQSFGISIE